MGHDIGLGRVYFKPTMEEVLEGNDYPFTINLFA